MQGILLVQADIGNCLLSNWTRYCIRMVHLFAGWKLLNRMQNVAWYDKANKQLHVKLHWQAEKQQLLIR